jgi:hypothetical protein
MEQDEARAVEALVQEIEEKKEDRAHVDGREPLPEPEPKLEAPHTEAPVYSEQDLEPQQYFGTEGQAPEAAIEVEMIKDESELERQPTILGIATSFPAKEAAPPAPASSQGGTLSVNAPRATARASLPTSSSSFVSSLHKSDVMR